MPIAGTLRVKVKPESVEKCKEAIREYVALVKDHEPGTLFYTVVQDNEDPTLFLFFRISEDKAAQDQHNNAPYLKRYADLVLGESTEPEIGNSYTIVAANWIV